VLSLWIIRRGVPATQTRYRHRKPAQHMQHKANANTAQTAQYWMVNRVRIDL